VNIVLTETEARVLGVLLEKEITTPDYYPLSLNALTNACNQKSNRDPLMTLDDDSVRAALRTLHDQSLARSVSAADSRVTKYEHRLQEAFNFDRREAAIFCELLLRGPQTPGELRTRAERMHPLADLGEVQSVLQRLITREPSLVKILPRQPGTKESRYTHLLTPDTSQTQPPQLGTSVHSTHGNAPQVGSANAREAHTPRAVHENANEHEVSRLSTEVAALRQEIAELKQQFAAFRKQFE
jgi:uncharacterized protein YceH (UPF0502 family)